MKICNIKIKSRLEKDGQFRNLIYKFFLKNYFVAWIANLGVVPLFLLAAFLLAPAFFFFLNLLFVVTHVLETIYKLPYRNRSISSFYNNFKPYFLPIKSSCVKGIFLCILLMTPRTLLLASENTEDIILAKGQTQELNLSTIEKFNIGNKDVVSYRFNEKTKKLLIRGAQLGHSEILIWNKDKSLKSYQVYIISKHQEAKFLHLAELSSHFGLSAKILIPHLKISGTINKLATYLNYKKLLLQNDGIILDEVKLSSELRNKIFANIYSRFFEDYKESINCQDEYSTITCFYPENESPSESLKKYLIQKFQVIFIHKNNQQLKVNYQLKMKLIQLEQLDGEDLRLGLEQVSGNLSDFLSIPIEKIVQKNQVLLSQKKVRLSTLAEPQTLIRSQTPAEMQIGADIPFKSTSVNNLTTTEWKFAGLKIKVELENLGDQLKINYEAELTQPSNDSSGVASIGGSKEKSSVVIPLNKAVKIFQLSLRTDGKSTDQLPFLNAIPILGELFKSKSNQSNYKTITGIIEVNIYE